MSEFVRDKIKAAFEEYRHVIEQVELRQRDWNGVTKQEILRVLSSISDELKPLKTVEDGSIRQDSTPGWQDHRRPWSQRLDRRESPPENRGEGIRVGT